MRFPRMLTKLNRVTRTPGMQKEQFHNSFLPYYTRITNYGE
jgi:hypothetical protein